MLRILNYRKIPDYNGFRGVCEHAVNLNIFIIFARNDRVGL